MRYFGQEAAPDMALVRREPERLLFSDPFGDLVVRVDAGRPNTVSVITSHWHAQAQEFIKNRAEPIDGAIRIEAETNRQPAEVLQRARDFFAEGMGLSLSAERGQSLEFTGGGGQVTVAAFGNGQPRLQVSSRAWDHQAEEFVRQLTTEH